MFLVNKKGTGIIVTMGKPVKHRVKLRRSSSVGVFKKRLFRRNHHVNLKTQRNVAEQGTNRTETRVKISTSTLKFHKSLRETPVNLVNQ